jgi:hypothetical protein
MPAPAAPGCHAAQAPVNVAKEAPGRFLAASTRPAAALI